MEGIFILLAFALGIVGAVSLWFARRGKDNESGIDGGRFTQTPPTRPRR